MRGVDRSTIGDADKKWNVPLFLSGDKQSPLKCKSHPKKKPNLLPSCGASAQEIKSCLAKTGKKIANLWLSPLRSDEITVIDEQSGIFERIENNVSTYVASKYVCLNHCAAQDLLLSIGNRWKMKTAQFHDLPFVLQSHSKSLM
jgi:hypothetical protein